MTLFNQGEWEKYYDAKFYGYLGFYKWGDEVKAFIRDLLAEKDKHVWGDLYDAFQRTREENLRLRGTLESLKRFSSPEIIVIIEEALSTPKREEA